MSDTIESISSCITEITYCSNQLKLSRNKYDKENKLMFIQHIINKSKMLNTYAKILKNEQ